MVLIAYIHGDPDRPVVAGFVVDKWNMPPWNLPANYGLSGIRTQSFGQGELASNHLALDDTQGKMQVQLASDPTQSRLVLGFNTRINGTEGRQEARGKGFELATNEHGVARANKGLLITTEARDGASAPVKDMGETVQRLAQAHQQHEALSGLAQRHEAQDMQHSQRDAIDTIRAQNDAIKGHGPATTENFPELAKPDLVMSSAAGIATTAEDSTHQASQKDHAITAGRDVSVSSGRSFIAAIRGAISWFAHQWGIKLIAGHGKVEIQAHNDAIALAALKDVSVKSVNGEVVIAAEKGIGLYVGGSYIRITPSGIENGTSGTILEKCASWSKQGAKTLTVPLPELPTGEMTSEWVTFVNHETGRPMANFPYRLDAGGGRIVEGVTDAKGRTAQVMAPTSQPVQIGSPAAQNSTDTYHVRFLDELGNLL